MTPCGDADAEELREDHADSAHLAHDVGHADENRADHGDCSGEFGIVAVTHEVRDGGFTELAQVGHHEHGQQHEATSPAHEETRAIVTADGNGAGHGDEGGSGHPVCGGRHAIGKWGDATTSGVVFLGG